VHKSQVLHAMLIFIDFFKFYSPGLIRIFRKFQAGLFVALRQYFEPALMGVYISQVQCVKGQVLEMQLFTGTSYEAGTNANRFLSSRRPRKWYYSIYFLCTFRRLHDEIEIIDMK
jgi:hypothetical protein